MRRKPRALKHNDFDLERIKRFLNYIWKSPSGCWLWTGTGDTDGYGRARYYDGSGLAAHRMSYAMFCGDVPSNLHVDHICRQRRCVNPTHLRLRDPIENCTDTSPPNTYKPEEVPF